MGHRLLRLVAAAAVAVAATCGSAEGAAAADTSVNAACAGTLHGAVFTLSANCDTTVPLTVPDGETLDGALHAITAHDPAAASFSGAVRG